MEILRKNIFWVWVGLPLVAALYVHFGPVQSLKSQRGDTERAIDGITGTLQREQVSGIPNQAEARFLKAYEGQIKTEMDSCKALLGQIDAPLDAFPASYAFPLEWHKKQNYIYLTYRPARDQIFAAAREKGFVPESSAPEIVFPGLLPYDQIKVAPATPDAFFQNLEKVVLLHGHFVNSILTPLQGNARLNSFSLTRDEPFPGYRGQSGTSAYEFRLSVEMAYQKVPHLFKSLYESRLTLFVPRSISISRVPGPSSLAAGTPVLVQMRGVAYDFDPR